ncbi:hypothetical protein LOAG_03156 [Loa loa]|uniref:Plasmid stabilization protein n=1 Tax=Loa loa TaxID=7209 RepID=A0A1I7VM32_LOALO|nr:hypothetical protein LOAG_03156 [Loa loa]EFO25327.2 hypothetical protein LOAG_03156 [Loa loa]
MRQSASYAITQYNAEWKQRIGSERKEGMHSDGYGRAYCDTNRHYTDTEYRHTHTHTSTATAQTLVKNTDDDSIDTREEMAKKERRSAGG